MLTEEEQRFWDAAFCAALTGCSTWTRRHSENVEFAKLHADAALTARRARMEK